MAHVTDDGLSPLVIPGSAPSDEANPADGPMRPSLPRTPPRVWPPVSPGDMGRVVRRLKLTAQRLGDAEPRVTLLGA